MQYRKGWLILVGLFITSPSFGQITGWGLNDYGQTVAPPELTTASIKALSGGSKHSLALKGDGTVVGWGLNNFGQATAPTGLSGVRAISAGLAHSLALTSDGTVVGWGKNDYNCTIAPSGLGRVFGIAAGGSFSLAIKTDGTVVAWGLDNYGLTSPPPSVNHVMAVAAGFRHAVALKTDGTVVCWGDNYWGQTTMPSELGSTVRQNHTATLLPGSCNQVLIAGGYSANGVTTNAALYNPANKNWASTGGLRSPRQLHTATLLGENGDCGDLAVLVVGGSDGTSTLDSSELYTSASGTWTATRNTLSTRRQYHTATLLDSGKVLVVGGSDGSNPLASAELYDPSTDRWAPAHSLCTAHQNHTATKLLTGEVLVVGGTDGSDFAKSAELYDPVTDSWTPTGHAAVVLRYHTATLLGNGQVLVAGGADGSDPVGGGVYTYDRFRGQNNGWDKIVGASLKRWFHTATLLQDGASVLFTGGYGSARDGSIRGVLADAELYNPHNGTMQRTANLFYARQNHTAALLPTGKVLVAGGNDGRGPLATAELYDPSTGIWAPASSPIKAIATNPFGRTSLALKEDGTVVGWGLDNVGQASGANGLPVGSVAAIAAGTGHGMALKRDGTVVCWGDNTYHQTEVPQNLVNQTLIAAGTYYSLSFMPHCDSSVGPSLSWILTDEGFVNGGRNGAFRIYADPSDVCFSPWLLTRSDLAPTLQMNFEPDSAACGGNNAHIQTGIAIATVTPAPCLNSWNVFVPWSGMVEIWNSRYDTMYLYAEGEQLGYAESFSPNTGPSCGVSPAVSPLGEPQAVFIVAKAPEQMKIITTTADEAQNRDCWYRFDLNLSTGSPVETIRLVPQSHLPSAAQFAFDVRNAPKNQSVQIDRSTDLATWTLNVGSVLTDGNGISTFTDTSAASRSIAFYRASSGSYRSRDAVGYVDKLIPSGWSGVANPFDLPPNTLDTVLPKCHDGTAFYKGQQTAYFDESFPGWDTGGNCDYTLSPGEAALMYNSGSAYTVSFIGSLAPGVFQRTIPQGTLLTASWIPWTGGLSSVLQYPLGPLDRCDRYVNGGTEISYYSDEDGFWDPSEPTPAIGESFSITSSVAKTWTQQLVIWNQ